MLKVIEYVRDALPAVGRYVMIDGCVGRLGIKKGLDPNKYAVSEDFRVFVERKSFSGTSQGVKWEDPEFPTNPKAGDCPLLISGLDLSESEPDGEDVCTDVALGGFTFDYTFILDEDLDYEVAPKVKESKKKEEKPSEGDELMDFFFSKEGKTIKKEEEREKWGTDGFEFF